MSDLGLSEQELIFLISQPRSGSSLLQQLLMGSEKVHSVPEPWLMLPLVSLFTDLGDVGRHHADYARINIKRSLEFIGEDDSFLKGKIQRFALDFYSVAMGQNKGLFLDKTPRYYHIVEELISLFPASRYLFLTRNPLSVFSSILAYNFNGDLRLMLSQPDRLFDLFLGPVKMLEAKKFQGPSRVYVCYEELVKEPEKVMSAVVSGLSLNGFTGSMTDYKVSELFSDSESVDRKSLAAHSTVVEDYVTSWVLALDTGEKRRAAGDYLELLGEDLVEGLGYSYQTLREQLKLRSRFFRGRHGRKMHCFLQANKSLFPGVSGAR
jgi:hypothetical protein